MELWESQKLVNQMQANAVGKMQTNMEGLQEIIQHLARRLVRAEERLAELEYSAQPQKDIIRDRAAFNDKSASNVIHINTIRESL